MSGWIGAWGNAATVTNLTVTGSEVISVNTSTDALRITQTGTGNALKVEDSANPDSSPFIIDNDGRVGIGGTPSAGRNLEILKSLAGAAYSYNINANYVIQSDVVTEGVTYQSFASTAAASFVLANLRHFKAVQSSIGATSGIGNQVGFWADASLTGATNNFGFYSNIASGSGRWNFYAAGTASNYFAGDLTFKPLASATPNNNGDLTFEATSNTSLKIKLKGSDGVVRSTTLTLA